MKKYLSSTLITALGVCALSSLTTGSALAADSVLSQTQSTTINSSAIPKTNSNKSQTDIYIVHFKGQPIINFGGSNAMAATKPADNQKMDINSNAVKDYKAFLSQTQNQALKNCGVAQSNKVYEYTYSFNGMAAKMTQSQAALMRSQSNVLQVTRDAMQKMDTDSTREFLELNRGRSSSWRRQGYTGENVIIGVLDSGINAEHPSFADVATPRRGDRGRRIPYSLPPEGWSGDECAIGNTDFNPLDVPFECNNKILGARFFVAGYLRGGDPADMLAAGSTLSARDDNGHGSASASNAAGNYGVQATIDGEDVGEDVMSGVAPRARIAIYKVCWDGPAIDDPDTAANEEDDGCANSDSMAAIDQAVADGVDVINFSIGGSSTSFGGLDAVAFLFAANAGVHVASSAGNSGPNRDTVGAPAIVPWVTSVGAVNDNQNFALGLQIDAPADLEGTVTAIEGSGAVQLEDAGPISSELIVAEPANGCEPLTNSETINGKIALIVRGVCAFNDKFANAEAAGAIAVVVYNDGTASDRQNPFVMALSEERTIPGVMIGFSNGDALVNGIDAAVTLDEVNQISLANRVVDFSSRGANLGALDIIKPDVVAPGVNILSAETTTENADEARGSTGVNSFQFISGTSFSSPHVAGVLALIKQARPDWSPAVAKSAMMTTARQNLSTQFSSEPATPFDIGAGHVVPNDTYEPGLAYEIDLEDYTAFTCGNNAQLFSDDVCDFLALQGRSFDGSELNLASIGIGELVGQQTVTRTVTNVDQRNSRRRFQRPSRYRAIVNAPDGINVTVSPRRLRLSPGQSADYTVTFTTENDANINEFVFGSVTWVEAGKRRRNRQLFAYYDYADYFYGYGSNVGYRRNSRIAKEVRSPIAVRPVALSAPSEVDSQAVTSEGPDGATAAGNVGVDIGFGYSGAYTPAFEGLSESLLLENTVSTDATLVAECFDLPAATHLRMATFDEGTTTPGGDDIDIRLFTVDDCESFDNLTQVGASETPSSNETVDVINPAAGSYVFVVDFFAAASGSEVDYRLWLSLVGGDDSNTTVDAPESATVGDTATITLDYADLNVDSRYLGVISHQDANGELGRTIVDVNTQ